jgi:hypothetical protein
MNDFCYIANLQTFTWVAQFANLTLPDTNGVTGARLAHSGKYTIFSTNPKKKKNWLLTFH